jgi:hypothetical protein
MTTPFFAMRNRHGPDSGEPPVFRDDAPGKYFGYFENALGEQWVFVYDRESRTAELSGGDIGWEQVIPVSEGKPAGLVLRPEEAHWLQSCWTAATTIR